ncbi:MAG TPA: hypothetical protein VFD47_06625 [Actinomycetota bacterium]|nr:hypothetical protein [Actinomycetota bacterium]
MTSSTQGYCISVARPRHRSERRPGFDWLLDYGHRAIRVDICSMEGCGTQEKSQPLVERRRANRQ